MKKFCTKLKENFFLYSSNDQIPSKNDLVYQVNSDDTQKENKKSFLLKIL